MWETTILGVDLYHILAWLYLYSFLGWVWESCYVSIKQKKLINRGYITGPLCTIYGVGAVSVYIILRPIADNLVFLYFGGVFVATALEYVTALIMETLFHTSWWDYSRKKFNYKGRICLGSSVAWGFFCIIMFRVLHPFVENIVSLVTVSTGEILIMAVTVLYAADFTFATITAMNLGQKLKSLEEIMGELAETVQKSRIYISAEELVEKLEPYRLSFNRQNVKEKLDQFQVHVTSLVEKEAEESQIVEVKNKLAQMKEWYVKVLTKTNWNARRLMKAYPYLSKVTKTKRHKKKDEK